MPCPHSRVGNPNECSQCIGAVPRKVEMDASGHMTIDGKPALVDGTARMFDPGVSERFRRYVKRGARARHNRTIAAHDDDADD